MRRKKIFNAVYTFRCNELATINGLADASFCLEHLHDRVGVLTPKNTTTDLHRGLLGACDIVRL